MRISSLSSHKVSTQATFNRVLAVIHKDLRIQGKLDSLHPNREISFDRKNQAVLITAPLKQGGFQSFLIPLNNIEKDAKQSSLAEAFLGILKSFK